MLVGQFFYYKPETKAIPHHGHFGHGPGHTPRRSRTVTRGLSVERPHSRYRALSNVAANVAAAAALAAQKEEEGLPPSSSRSLRPYPTYGADETTQISAGLSSAVGEDALEGEDLLGASFYSEGGRSIGRKRLAWSVERPSSRGRAGSVGHYPPMPHSTTPTAFLTPEIPSAVPAPLQNIADIEEDELSDASNAQRSTRASRRGATMVFLSAWALFGIGSLASRGVDTSSPSQSVGRLLYPGESLLSAPAIPRALSTPVVEVSQIIPKAWHEGAEPSYVHVPALNTGAVDNEPKLPPTPEPPHHEDPDYERVLGRIFAWLCTTLYLTSRLPQIWKNVCLFPSISPHKILTVAYPVC